MTMALLHILKTFFMFNILTLVIEIHSSSFKLTTELTTQYAPENYQVCDKPILHNGEMTETKGNFTQGESIQISCLSGYRLPFTKAVGYLLTCGIDGQWIDMMGTTDIPNCERTGGCPPAQIPHGQIPIKPEGYMPGDLAKVTCNQGYVTLAASALIRCKKDGTWQTHASPFVVPQCRRIECQVPRTPPHGSVKVDFYAPEITRTVPEGVSIHYSCNKGYRMDDPSKEHQTCGRTQWTSSPPVCIMTMESNCFLPPQVKHANFRVYSKSGSVVVTDIIPDGSWVRYSCDKGYILTRVPFPVCSGGKWKGAIPQCVSVIRKECAQPPTIEYGNFITSSDVTEATSPYSDGYYSEGLQVHYYCDNGYKLKDVNTTFLVCHDGDWQGIPPDCERRTHCDNPMDILNGNWVIKTFRPKYGIGSRVSYECRDGYKAIGTTDIECMSTGYWSDYAPRCLAASKYCSEPGPLENGVYMCRPSHCNLFKIGTEIHFVCNKFYEPRSNDIMVQKCMDGGLWSGQKPVCEAVNAKTTTDNLVSFNTSTLTVVIATSCGVLGLLVVVMVVVALQRRRKKPRSSRLCHPSSPHPPPPYNPAPPTGLVDEPDRVALIAFADGVQVVLPSYEEATRGRPGSRISRYTSDSTRGSIRSSSSRDYRPLPSLPSSLRTGGPQIREIPPDHHRDHHRNSIITTASTTTRDNLSLALGSIDTMNISDGTSTSVTVDTASSNPSIATSQRATAGSIESSSTNGSLATEDVPLLDQNHYGTETMRSHHSNTSDPYHGNTSRCQCTDRIGGYDTLRSQGSRSQSESSPIVEVPEELKDP